MAREAVRLDAAQRGVGDGVLQAAAEPRGRARQPGRDLTLDAPRPIIVTAELGPADHAWADGLRRRYFPPERNQLAAHLTMFHHIPPSAGDELDRRLAALCRRPAPPAKVPGLLNLGRGVALKVDSPELQEIRAELADALAGLLLPQDRQGWRPHVTVQNKVEPAVARATLAELSAGFAPRPVRIAGLASWDYLGGPWGERSRFAFRG